MKTYLIILLLNPLGDWGVAEGFEPLEQFDGFEICTYRADQAYNYLSAVQDKEVYATCIETKDINRTMADFGLAV